MSGLSWFERWVLLNSIVNGRADTQRKLQGAALTSWGCLLACGSLGWALFTLSLAGAAVQSVIRQDWPNAAAQAVLALVSGVTLRWLTRRGR